MGVVFTTACAGTAARVTPLGPTYPPWPADTRVAIFATARPSCDYEEIAVLVVRDSWHADADDLLNRMKEEARGLGGDALVGLRDGMGGARALSATVVRLSDKACSGEAAIGDGADPKWR
jgi:hypothetical protein